MGTEVLLYVPNLIGYIRLGLLVAAWALYNYPSSFCCLYLASTLLDGVDGIAARKLNQVSAFGAWMDVVIDNISRALLWCNLFHFGFLVTCLEWLVFVCAHSQKGVQWKSVHTSMPVLVKVVMEKNFKTPIGQYVVISLFGLPLWLYAHYMDFLSRTLGFSHFVCYLGIAVLSVGRALSLPAELWFIWIHIKYLLNDDQTLQELKSSSSADDR